MNEYVASKEMNLEELSREIYSAGSFMDKEQFSRVYSFSDCPCPCPPVANAVLYVTFSPIF
jgi:hypothetical protein